MPDDHRPNHRNGSVFKKYERVIFSSVDLSIIHSKTKTTPYYRSCLYIYITLLPIWNN